LAREISGVAISASSRTTTGEGGVSSSSAGPVSKQPPVVEEEKLTVEDIQRMWGGQFNVPLPATAPAPLSTSQAYDEGDSDRADGAGDDKGIRDAARAGNDADSTPRDSDRAPSVAHAPLPGVAAPAPGGLSVMPSALLLSGVAGMMNRKRVYRGTDAHPELVYARGAEVQVPGSTESSAVSTSSRDADVTPLEASESRLKGGSITALVHELLFRNVLGHDVPLPEVDKIILSILTTAGRGDAHAPGNSAEANVALALSLVLQDVRLYVDVGSSALECRFLDHVSDDGVVDVTARSVQRQLLTIMLTAVRFAALMVMYHSLLLDDKEWSAGMKDTLLEFLDGLSSYLEPWGKRSPTEVTAVSSQLQSVQNALLGSGSAWSMPAQGPSETDCPPGTFWNPVLYGAMDPAAVVEALSQGRWLLKVRKLSKAGANRHGRLLLVSNRLSCSRFLPQSWRDRSTFATLLWFSMQNGSLGRISPRRRPKHASTIPTIC
jgi:hypothetical protein